MERVTPKYVYFSLKVLCIAFLAVGALFTCLWLGLMLVDIDKGFGFQDAVDATVVSGLFFVLSYLYVICRARRAEQFAALLLSIPVVLFVHFVTSVFIAHDALRWLSEIVNVVFAYGTARGVLKLGDLYYRARSAS